MEQAVVTAVTHDTTEAKVTVTGVPDRPGMAARLFRALAERSINVDMIVQNISSHGTTDISFTLPKLDLATAVEVCTELSAELGASGVISDDGIARVSVVGAGMKTHPGVTATMFETLANGRHQHRDDLHVDDPDLLRRAGDRRRAGCAVAARGIRAGVVAAGPPHPAADAGSPTMGSCGSGSSVRRGRSGA